MMESLVGHDGRGLERSCTGEGGDWFLTRAPGHGIEVLEAWFNGHAYDNHRHDTYAIGVTAAGAQQFDYRGAAHTSTAGQVIVLHPDELHNGRSGDERGFGYRMIYVEPSLVSDAVQALCGRPAPLPFVPEPVSVNGTLASAVAAACTTPLEPAAADTVLLALAEGLLEEAGTARESVSPARVDAQALVRVRDYLHANHARPVRSHELEAVSGLDRFRLARQFRELYGTSPYRYLIMRRLDVARRLIAAGMSLAQIAAETGFADQAHFTRVFRAAFGLTPSRHRALYRAALHAGLQAWPARSRAYLGL